MKTPTVPKQKAPVSRFVPRLNQPIGVLWFWGTKLNKRSSGAAGEPLLEVFPTHDVAETLRSMKSATGGPRRYATHVAFEPFESFEEAKEYATQAITLFQPEDQTPPAKIERGHAKDAQNVL